MKVITNIGQKLPVKLWMDDFKSLESGAWDQVYNLSNLPFAFKHIAVMPDAHQGYGMPIGGIMATKGVIVPNAVGVDIGCGMCAVKTSLREIDTDTLKKIMGEIRKVIPLGFNKHKTKQDESLMPMMEADYKKGETAFYDELKDRFPIIMQEYENALCSLGTLGGGNHFIEIQKGSDGHIWIMVHSGSRNLGFKVANYYNKLAVELNQKWHSSVPKNQQLAYLPVDNLAGQNYINEMEYCVDFALANRKLMMDRICESIVIVTSSAMGADKMINIAHNYASLENHFGQNVWVHRKGATKATEGLTGIIPGSMGTKSYIVKGKGNRESFMSCSHGAGRKMSRTEAKKTLNLEEEQKKMEGIVGGIRSQGELDEAPGSYKDIQWVMKQQKDLVDIEVELTPIAVIKS